jgi:hypothetical protein
LCVAWLCQLVCVIVCGVGVLIRDKIRWLGLGFHVARYTTRDATQFRDAWAPHSHTQTQRHGAGVRR